MLSGPLYKEYSGMNRILVIRGGAIGDFILTLPAIGALRRANPDARIEVLGYKHIAELANNRFYANSVRSIEYGPLSRFFAKEAELSSELKDYFAGFDLVISYLFDPDEIFENNLRRCGSGQFIRGPAKLMAGEHAASQLAQPVRQLGLIVDPLAARLYPSADDREMARDFLANCPQPVIAFHPGSGSERKNWPLENWITLGNSLITSPDILGSILVVCGEADTVRTARLKSIWTDRRVRFVENVTLPHLAALLEHAIFIGHDSGISHLAAAAGANCVLLFGATDPAVWAPVGDNVHVIRAPDGDLQQLDVEMVRSALLVGERRQLACSRRQLLADDTKC
jgi:ADP-heptose:LPS heptosyltransferase